MSLQIKESKSLQNKKRPEQRFMENLADFLMQEQLLTLPECERLKEKIEKNGVPLKTIVYQMKGQEANDILLPTASIICSA